MLQIDRRGGPGPTSAQVLLRGNADIAAFLGIPERSISTLVRDAGLPVVRVGWWHFSTPRLIVEWIENRARGKAGDA
jgi:hypothetical protein